MRRERQRDTICQEKSLHRDWTRDEIFTRVWAVTPARVGMSLVNIGRGLPQSRETHLHADFRINDKLCGLKFRMERYQNKDNINLMKGPL